MAVHGAWQVDAVWFLGFLGFSTISDSRGRIFSANRHILEIEYCTAVQYIILSHIIGPLQRSCCLPSYRFLVLGIRPHTLLHKLVRVCMIPWGLLGRKVITRPCSTLSHIIGPYGRTSCPYVQGMDTSVSHRCFLVVREQTLYDMGLQGEIYVRQKQRRILC
jgi:hypothetical protein